jgi:hypothetical protein
MFDNNQTEINIEPVRFEKASEVIGFVIGILQLFPNAWHTNSFSKESGAFFITNENLAFATGDPKSKEEIREELISFYAHKQPHYCD